MTKSELTDKTLVYQPLNELSMDKIVQDRVVPSFAVVRYKLTPHRIIAFDPLM